MLQLQDPGNIDSEDEGSVFLGTSVSVHKATRYHSPQRHNPKDSYSF
jgi:hypothetical protein